jgi:hypothetical protein
VLPALDAEAGRAPEGADGEVEGEVGGADGEALAEAVAREVGEAEGPRRAPATLCFDGDLFGHRWPPRV